MEMNPKRDPLLCECCRRPEAQAVAYDLPTGKFVCAACHARLRRDRIRRGGDRLEPRVSVPHSGDGH